MNSDYAASPVMHLDGEPGTKAVDNSPPSLRIACLAAGICLAITIVLFGAVYIFGKSSSFVRDNFNEIMAVVIFIHALTCLSSLVAIIKRFNITPAALGIARPARRLAHLVWQIPCAMVVLVIVQAGMFLALGGQAPVPDRSSSSSMMGLSPIFAVLGFAAIAIVTPLWEELFFRGFLFSSVRARFGTSLAIAVSAILFAVAHGIPIILPYMFTLGMILAALRLFHDSLWAPLVLHMFINTVVSIGIIAALF